MLVLVAPLVLGSGGGRIVREEAYPRDSVRSDGVIAGSLAADLEAITSPTLGFVTWTNRSSAPRFIPPFAFAAALAGFFIALALA